MGKHEELIKTDKTLFSEYSYRDWCDYYMSLNAELPPDKCPVKLSQNEAVNGKYFSRKKGIYFSRNAANYFPEFAAFYFPEFMLFYIKPAGV